MGCGPSLHRRAPASQNSPRSRSIFWVLLEFENNGKLAIKVRVYGFVIAFDQLLHERMIVFEPSLPFLRAFDLNICKRSPEDGEHCEQKPERPCVLIKPRPSLQEIHRANFLYFTRFGSSASGPRRRFLSSS